MNGLEETKQAVKYLKAARKLITPEGSWCKGWFAKTSEGMEVGAWHEQASSFCSYGALERAANTPCAPFTELGFAFDGDITNNNDKRTTKHLHVLMAYDFAILHAEDEVKRLKKLEKAL